MRRGILLCAIALAAANQAHADAVFSGRLAAAPCQADQDLIVVDADVRDGEDIECRAGEGDTIHLTETTIPAGARFAARVGGPTAHSHWAETSCDPSGGVFSDRDCNRCVNDVVSQFEALFDDFVETEHSWTYREYGIYRPSDAEPREFTNGNANSHVQGFVRTNSEVHPFAGTYSRDFDSNRGFMFVIEDEGDDLELEMLHRAWDNHPSGAAILGSRMWFGDHASGIPGYVVRAIEVDWPGATQQPYLVLPDAFEGRRPTVGGGLGLAKLRSGGHLLVAMGPGGAADDPSVDFFYLSGEPNPETGEPLGLGTVGSDGRFALDVTPLSRWYLRDAEEENEATSEAFKRSENISVVNECGTGDVYVINTTGETNSILLPGDDPFDPTEIGKLYGKGLYRLSRVEWGPLEFHNAPSDVPVGSMGPKLQPVAWRMQSQNPHRCHVRSAATFWANESNELELYCSEFSAVDGETRMHFTRRRAD